MAQKTGESASALDQTPHKNTIVKRPTFIKVIKEEATIDLFNDENITKVVAYLRKGPMTLNELMVRFAEDGDPKSEKTIYRYLKQLKDHQLIDVVGTRTGQDEDGDMRDEKLYGRTAGIFYWHDEDIICCKEYPDKEKAETMEKVLEILLKAKYPKI